MSDKDEIDRVLRGLPLAPRDLSNPFQALLSQSAAFNNFDDGDPQLMREALGNVRSIKQRAMEAMSGMNWLLHEAYGGESDAILWAKEPMSLLTELVQDMDAIERKIVDRMIEGRDAA
ncbi:hypothetical protein TspCOW1_29740 [Thiohalobacter sp. COW1]|uniref:hypothetical protein n=1 Tax=Thiohalobacter sp. COW1 TaxID=2795687 RepID=UPI00191689C1|nr:hypothetical protein [Thiohalobacter sp. COW1]BCO32871.1 hypothetical protein TspCOW1_29740 [Thiohalobacter sp. COW1]